MRAHRSALWCALLSLLGLGVCGVLVYLHLGLLRGELLGGAVCGEGTFNCHAVTASAWSTAFGMPLAFWGLLGYVAVLAVALLARQSPATAEALVPLLAWLSIGFVLADAVLLFLMVAVIRYLCLFCLATYGINLLLVGLALRALSPPRLVHLGRLPAAVSALFPSPQRAVGLFWALLLVGGGGVVGLHVATTFVVQGAPGAMTQQLRQYVRQQPRVRVPTEGSPRLGPADASLQIVEFSDFLCAACQRASKLNTVLLASHRRDGAFIFKHYPLDTSCNSRAQRMVHPGACQVAAAAACADQQGKFWEFHDRVFATGPTYTPARIDDDARTLGLDMTRFGPCLASGAGLEAVQRDIAEGAGLDIHSTPTYVINGVRFSGLVSPAVFEDLVTIIREGAAR